MNKTIKCCIFDLGGTIVDKYSITPTISIKKLFEIYKIKLPDDLITEYMGIEKKRHIEIIMDNKNILNNWEKNNDEKFNKIKLNDMFSEYKKIEKDFTLNNMKIIPQTWRCINELKDMNILIGSTTGFDSSQVDLIKYKLETRGIFLDNYESSCFEQNIMRPGTEMIMNNLDKLNIEDPKSVLKIDDTNIGIEEGGNAGCLTVGVYRWSSYMNVMSYRESIEVDNIILGDNNNYNENYSKLVEKKEKSKNKLKESKCHFVVPSVGYVPNIVKDINNMEMHMSNKYIA